MDLEKYRRLFVDEASDHLAEMSRAYTALASGATGERAQRSVEVLFRMAHSIKSMAASLDYDSISMLAHRLEDWLEPMRSGGSATDSMLELLSESLRALELLVAAVEETGAAVPIRGELLERLAAPITIETAQEESGADSRRSEPSTAGVASALPRSVRVRAEVVDRFLSSVGELMQRQSRLEALYRALPLAAQDPDFGEELARMENVVRELRRRALDIRTTPLRRVLERLPRLANDLARELGKRVRVEIAGEEIEVDRTILDHLDEPLLHLVRNAVDHGLEPPDTRERLGKDPAGTIRISAACAAGRLTLCIEEDGAGIDVEAVRKRAVERGLLLEMVAEDLPPERICELIFESGISTRDAVTEVSGRGVGLDAVKRAIEGLGGSIAVRNRPGGGTAFEIDLPTMAALQRVLVLEAKGARVAIAMTQIEAVLAERDARVERPDMDAFFVFQEEPLPLLDLAEQIGLGARAARATGAVVVLEARGFRFGLLVDRALADREVFVREVPLPLDRISVLGGVAILPDGAPVFLLDLGSLVESFA